MVQDHGDRAPWLQPLEAFYLLKALKASPDVMLLNTKNTRHGFTLVEIMIVVAIIALLAAIAVPGFLRSRKRSQAAKIKNDLRLIDSAIAQYAIETNKKTGDAVYVDDWLDYLKPNTALYNTGQDIFGNNYGDQAVDAQPNVPVTAWNALSDVVDSDFWSPFQVAIAEPAVHKERVRTSRSSY